MLNPFKTATEDDRQDFKCGGKMAEIEASANEIIELLGQPEEGSADGKTDVEFYALNDFGDLINLWNWKDGGYIDEEFDYGAYRFFSVWYSDPRALEQFGYWLNLMRKS